MECLIPYLHLIYVLEGRLLNDAYASAFDGMASDAARLVRDDRSALYGYPDVDRNGDGCGGDSNACE